MNNELKGVGGMARQTIIERSVDTLANKDSRVKTAVITISSNSSSDLEYNVILNDFDSDL